MDKKIFGEYIRQLRTERGYSLRALSKEIGVTPYYLSYMENGIRTNPNKKIIAQLFSTLNLDKDEIETFFDLHAKANGFVSYDIVEYIMTHDELRKEIRLKRDKSSDIPDGESFIDRFKALAE